jgi:hypothetical protein
MPTVTNSYPGKPDNADNLDADIVAARIDALFAVINALDRANIDPAAGQEIQSSKIYGDAVDDTVALPVASTATTNLLVRLNQMLAQIKAITGKAAWYTALGAGENLTSLAASSGMADPMTTAGDVIIRNGANTTARLAAGSSNQLLVISSGVPAWTDVLTSKELKDYSETVSTNATSGIAATIDLDNGNVHDLTLTANCTLTFSNPPATGKAGSFTLILRQDATGSRTVTWPASVKWSGGTAPTLTTTASGIDILTFTTLDAGTAWFGFTAGQGMA